MTLETEIPEPIPKDQRKKNPDEKEFKDKMSAFDQQIEQGRNRITGLIAKKREAIDGGKVQGSSLTYKDFFKTKVDELKALRDQKGKKHDEQRRITDKLDALEQER